MTRPLPPIVHKPITAKSESIQLTSVEKNAIVYIFVDDIIVVETISTNDGTLSVGLGFALVTNQEIKARQKTKYGTSDDSDTVIVSPSLD
ncbi:hypothetical protein KQ3_04916 [Bacillus cereus B5-2]|nr:hypothetical protein KQ3_04916 [Bacillus cereus B5-2]